MFIARRAFLSLLIGIWALAPELAKTETPPLPTPKPVFKVKTESSKDSAEQPAKRYTNSFLPRPKPGRKQVRQPPAVVPKSLKLGAQVILLPRVKPSGFQVASLTTRGSAKSQQADQKASKKKLKLTKTKPKKKKARKVASLQSPTKILTTPPATIDPGFCQRELARHRVTYTVVDPIRNAQGCNLNQGVRITRIGAVKIKSAAIVNCNTAIKFANWVENSVQRRANAILRSPVSTLHQYSGYSCRYRSKGKVSEHGYGNAIDIGRVTLKDGRVVSVDKDWDGEWQDHASFLKAITHDACDIFQLVLTPYSNAAHHDHLHFDLGKWKKCEATREAAAN